MLVGPSILALLCFYVLNVTASWSNLLGPVYVAPKDVSGQGSALPAAWKNFTSIVEGSLTSTEKSKAQFPGLANFTFSIGLFSRNDPEAAKMQYHHTGKDVKESTVGVDAVDGDSVYRIASITKLFTVYLLLVELGDKYWARPITDFLPELANSANGSANDPVQTVKWSKITLGALASHMSGVGRNPAPYNRELLSSISAKDIAAQGLPPLNSSLLPPCALRKDLACPTAEYLDSLKDRTPVFEAWQSPAYSDAGFALLALAVEKIKSRSVDSLFNEAIFKPLQMASSSYTVPSDNTHGVVPGSAANVSFEIDYGNASASGGVFSTTNDLSKLGVAILNSTLLPAEQTREWLKPVTHTGDLQSSIGRPWEILRIPQPAKGRVVDLYTKAGGVNRYSSYLALSPDHEYGFSVLAAGLSPELPLAAAFLADTLASTLIPALESQAASETAKNFAGLYRSDEGGLNSSFSLATGPSSPAGLVIESWVSNGTDVLALLPLLFGGSSVVLSPSITDQQGGKAAFRSISGPSESSQDGAFSRQLIDNGGWEFVDTLIYGGNSLDLFEFDVGEDGAASAVTPAIMRATLKRVP
ncbi:MAG: hypothetical protein M1825_000687 [Sarcosagium campestre]|nr:MAG: hypothetical protein M1825_000687 [Sarcosagium campestre]